MGPEGAEPLGKPVGVGPEGVGLLEELEGLENWRFSKGQLVGKPVGNPVGTGKADSISEMMLEGIGSWRLSKPLGPTGKPDGKPDGVPDGVPEGKPDEIPDEIPVEVGVTEGTGPPRGGPWGRAKAQPIKPIATIPVYFIVDELDQGFQMIINECVRTNDYNTGNMQ